MIFSRVRSAVKKSYRKVFHRSSSHQAVARQAQVSLVKPTTLLSIPPDAPSTPVLKSALSSIVPAAVMAKTDVDMSSRFKKAVVNEMMLFKQNAEHFASGDAGFSNSWSQWIGLGAISSGVAVVNTGIALISAFGLLMAPATAGIALAVSIAGIISGIAFNIYMYKRKQNEFARAEKFMERDNIERDMEKFVDTLANIFHDELLNCTRYDAEMLAKASCAVISKAILKGDITSFDELQSPAGLRLLLADYASYAPQYKFHMKAGDKKAQNSRDILKALVTREPVSPKKSMLSDWFRSAASTAESTKDEHKPLLAASVSSQSLFAKVDLQYRQPYKPVPPTTLSPRRMR